MINIDTHFFLEARHVDFMATIEERLWFANTTNHDAFRTVSNLLCFSPLSAQLSCQPVTYFSLFMKYRHSFATILPLNHIVHHEISQLL